MKERICRFCTIVLLVLIGEGTVMGLTPFHYIGIGLCLWFGILAFILDGKRKNDYN